MKNIVGSGIQGAMGTSGGNVRQTSGPPGILNGNLTNEKAATQELDMLLKSHSRLDNILNTRDMGSLHRSGSAPPSVEGSLASISGNQLLGSGGVIGSGIVESEQQLRSDPTYLAYYYSHVSLNPRLPPPLITRENYHLAQQLAAGRLKSLDNSNGRSLFLSQSMLPTHNEEPELENEKLPLRKEVRGDGSSAYASRSNNMVSRLQEDASGTSTSHANASNPAINSRSATPNPLLSSRSTTPKPAIMHMLSNSTVGSVSRIPTSEQAGRLAGVTGTTELSARLQNINLSGSSDKQEEEGVQLQYALQQTIRAQQHQNPHRISGPESSNRVQARYNPSNSTTSLQQQVAGATNNMAAAAAMSYMATNPYYPSLPAYAPLYGLGAYTAVNPSLIPAVMANYPSYDTTSTRTPPSGSSNGVGVDVQQLYKYSSQGGVPLQTLQDPLYYHYLQQYSAENARNALNLGDPRGTYGSVDPLEMQKNQINSLLQLSRAVPYGAQPGNKNNSYAPAYYGAPGIGFVMPYGSSSISSPLLPGSPMVANAFSLRQTDPRIPVGVGRTNIHMGTSDSGEEIRGSTLLEELKNNKTRKFELTDIAGHVVEFSSDQHGSRFIQQKLESVSLEEKELVFQEVLPHAFNLMTDVFGNYVIQKFLEHGSLAQRLQLIEQLVGHVLALTLQMYGCRVIQKALEVLDVEQQIKIISELDGHVMRCVRDQNGNHVIQKCIECVPSDHILFILSSFKGQVVVLSTHPYGCRVIQRVLEHCNDEQKQGGIMKEILEDVCTLAQDQYGNYVVQHILEHGKPEEKTEILTKMVGQIVQMSQHKFASNVVEKCLEFGGPKERQMLITEMLGQTDENEPLQAMMKDQFANYVVQKVLETCDDQQREVLLSRIRVHLHALKKYTYGKHIVTRVEKLVMAGERRGAATV